MPWNKEYFRLAQNKRRSHTEQTAAKDGDAQRSFKVLKCVIHKNVVDETCQNTKQDSFQSSTVPLRAKPCRQRTGPGQRARGNTQ